MEYVAFCPPQNKGAQQKCFQKEHLCTCFVCYSFSLVFLVNTVLSVLLKKNTHVTDQP